MLQFKYHVEFFPDNVPFSHNERDFSDDGILQWNNRLEESFVVDLAWLYVNVGTRENSFYCSIFRRKSSVPS